MDCTAKAEAILKPFEFVLITEHLESSIDAFLCSQSMSATIGTSRFPAFVCGQAQRQRVANTAVAFAVGLNCSNVGVGGGGGGGLNDQSLAAGAKAQTKAQVHLNLNRGSKDRFVDADTGRLFRQQNGVYNIVWVWVCICTWTLRNCANWFD